MLNTAAEAHIAWPTRTKGALPFLAALFGRHSQRDPVPGKAAPIELAQEAADGDSVRDCVGCGRFSDMVDGLAAVTRIDVTPTGRSTGTECRPTTSVASMRCGYSLLAGCRRLARFQQTGEVCAGTKIDRVFSRAEESPGRGSC